MPALCRHHPRSIASLIIRRSLSTSVSTIAPRRRSSRLSRSSAFNSRATASRRVLTRAGGGWDGDANRPANEEKHVAAGVLIVDNPLTRGGAPPRALPVQRHNGVRREGSE